MKKLFFLLILIGSFNCISQNKVNEDSKAYIEKDSTIWVHQGINREHRIFGYQTKNIDSKKMLLISVFTKDVKDNPFNCEYGAYYHTQGMDGIKLKFVSKEEGFMKIIILKNDLEVDTIYMEEKWFEFEK